MEENPTPRHLFILSGQSNMQGLNLQVSFTPTVESAFGSENVLVVKEALGGKPIRHWMKNWNYPEGKDDAENGVRYARLLEVLEDALEEIDAFDTVTFIWMQGERDAREKLAGYYKESLEKLIAQLEEDLGRDDINIIIGRLSDHDMENKVFGHWTRIREIQETFADSRPYACWIDSDDLNGDDNNLHLTKEGYAVLGERFARAAIRLIHERLK